MAVAAKSSSEKRSFLETPLFATLVVNWEVVLYATIFLLAVATRFYDLGARVMSHDESLHALFSYKLYNGEGYKHDPLMHGPLQFHLVALSYLLFGDNDFSARIPVAVFGVALVMLPYWLRPWLGKIGALATSVGLLISPMILYYSRYIRNEAYIAFFTALLAVSLFQFIRTRHQRWLYVGALAVSLSLSAKEVAFIHGFIGVVFILAIWMWESLSPRRFRQVLTILAAVTVAVLVGALFLTSPPAPENGHPKGGGLHGVLLMLSGLLIGVVTIAPNANRRERPVSSALAVFADRQTALNLLAGPVTVAAVLFFLLHTTFFTNPSGFITGTWGAVSYWLKQQDVARGGQPVYYYLMLMPLYEFLPFFVGGIGGLVYLFRGAPSHLKEEGAVGAAHKTRHVRKRRSKEAKEQVAGETAPPYPSDGGTFAAYLIFWAIGSFVIYSWAGEKMPWLTVHITLPFIFLVGHVTQTVFRRFEWAILKGREGLLYALLVPLWGAVLLVMLSSRPFQGKSVQDLQTTLRFIVALAGVVAVSFGLWQTGRRIGWAAARRILYLVVWGVLSILTIRFAWLSSFVNYDYVNEFLVYAHAAPDVKWVLNEVDDISRRTVGDRQIKVAYGGVIWPLEWYMRLYPNRAFFGSDPNRNALDAPVVIFSPDKDVSLDDVEPYLGDRYKRFKYRQVWWPIEDYKDQSLQKIWRTYFVPAPPAELDGSVSEEAWQEAWQRVRENRKWLWDVIFYRKVNDRAFSDWPYRTQMYLYVRKDVLNELWDYRTGAMSLEETVADPYAEVQRELPATRVWGHNGADEGQFAAPRAVAVSPQGQVFVADSGNHRIQVFDANGEFLKAWGGVEGPGPGQLTEPWGIAIGDDRRVYVSDTWNHRVQIFDEDGNFLSQFGSFADTEGDVNAAPGAFWGPRGILIAPDGNLYVADTGNKRIQKFTPDGQFLGAWGGGGIVAGRFDEPTSLAMDSQGNLYVADTWNHRIQKFDPDFNFLAEWPVVGWESQSVVNKPFIAVDAQDRVFVSDPENYRIIVYSSDGELLATFGQYGQDVQSFRLPLGLAFGPDGALYVVDADNNRMMKFQVPAW